jgi:hypothetical protein
MKALKNIHRQNAVPSVWPRHAKLSANPSGIASSIPVPMKVVMV